MVRLQPEKKDSLGLLAKDYEDAMAAMPEALLEDLADRARDSTTNYLFAFGVPAHPADLLEVAYYFFRMGLATAMVRGYATLDLDLSPVDEEEDEPEGEDATVLKLFSDEG